MNAAEADAEEIIEMATKASFADQQKQVQENIHSQVKSFCMHMDEILLPDMRKGNEPAESPEKSSHAVRKVVLVLLLAELVRLLTWLVRFSCCNQFLEGSLKC